MSERLKVHFSSKRQDWATPTELFIKLAEQYGPFTIDVCASKENAKCPRFFSIKEDGLKQDWSKERCWMNPPYGQEIKTWVQKAYDESLNGAFVVCLLPSRTDTRWFHSYCLRGEITFLKGRIKFGNATNSAPFPSMIVVFRPKPGIFY